MSIGALKSMGYDHPAYTTRQSYAATTAAGAGGVSAKFVAYAALTLFGLNVQTLVAGTSTYTYTQGGTATVAVAAQQLNLIRITDTNTTGVGVPTLSTSTIGPFTQGGRVAANGTLTNAIGAFSQFQLNTATGTAGFGGVNINQGDQFYIVSGTDATGTVLAQIDYQVTPLAGVLS